MMQVRPPARLYQIAEGLEIALVFGIAGLTGCEEARYLQESTTLRCERSGRASDRV